MARPAKAPPLLSEQILGRLRPFVLLQNILTYYIDLPCFMIAASDPRTWRAIVTLRRKNTPVDYENFEQWEERIRYNERIIHKVVKERRAVCQALQGVYGLFVPVLAQGRCVAVLQSGAFLREVPTPEMLSGQWKSLTGRPPRQDDRDFVEYARALCDCPVLEPRVLDGLQKALEIFAASLTGARDGEAAAKDLEALQNRVFARQLWHRQWVDWQVIQKKFFRFNSDPKTLMDWEVTELGIRRFPTTVLAAKREGSGQEWVDWLNALSFQREARRVAPSLGETLAYPLENYGVLLLSSADPKLGPAKAKAQIKEKAEQFSRLLSKRFHCKVWVGAGQSSATGIGLPESYREAILALHLAVAKDKALVFHADQELAELGGRPLRHKITALTEALLEDAGASALRSRKLFIQELLIETGGRPEAMRRLFLEAYHRLLEALENRKQIPAKDLGDFEREASFQLDSALNLNEMVGRFEAGTDLLLGFLAQPVAGAKYFRLRQAREAVLASLQRPWTLGSAAREHGFSVSSFSREFSRFAGLPFSDYLLAQRLEKAKRLLAESDSSLSLIAEACGFSSTNYFLQIFKKKVGSSPGQFRQISPSSKRT